jgi:hypothetical protein
MKLRKANKRATTSAFYPDSKIPRKCLNLLDYEAGKIGISGSWCRTSVAFTFALIGCVARDVYPKYLKMKEEANWVISQCATTKDEF